MSRREECAHSIGFAQDGADSLGIDVYVSDFHQEKCHESRNILSPGGVAKLDMSKSGNVIAINLTGTLSLVQVDHTGQLMVTNI